MRISRTMLGLFIATILFVLTLAARAAAAEPVYAATQLGTIGGAQSEAYAINDYGEIVGRAFDTEDEGQIFYYQNGTMVALFHELPWGRIPMPRTQYSVGYGMSNTGYAIAYVMDTSTSDPSLLEPAAVLFRPTASDVTMPDQAQAITYIGVFCSPTCISSSGRYVVGWGNLECTDQVFGFVLTPDDGSWAAAGGPACIENGLLISLGTLDALDRNSTASAVNNHGEIVGWSYSDTGGYQAYVVNPTVDVGGNPTAWYVDAGGANSLMTALGTLPGADGTTYGMNSWARDINDAGLIVGEADTGDYETHAFLYRNSAMIDLGTLGGAASSACAINEDGQIVGWAYNAVGKQRAFVITPLDTNADSTPDTWYTDEDADGINDLMLDLNSVMTSGFRLQLTEARDINLHGQIVGWGTNGTGTTMVRLAFLLTPTGATPGDDGDDGGAALTDAPLAPLLSDPSDGSPDTDNDDAAQQSTTAGTFGLTHWLCGVGFMPMLPLMLAGLCVMKVAVRRR